MPAPLTYKDIATATRRRDPSKPLETVIGYQEGWRWFRFSNPVSPFHRSWPYLSTGQMSGWSADGENVADEIPSMENHNGFYAYKSNCIEFVPGNHWQLGPIDTYIIAKVALYGTVIEHEFGYRAEKARILSVYVHKNMEIVIGTDEFPLTTGTWSVSSNTLYNMYGQEVIAGAWLTLENHNESADSSPLNFPIKENSESWLNRFHSPLSSPPPSRNWNRKRSRPDSGYCPGCGYRLEPWQIAGHDKVSHAGCITSEEYVFLQQNSGSLIETIVGCGWLALDQYLKPRVEIPEWIDIGGLWIPGQDPYETETYWWLM